MLGIAGFFVYWGSEHYNLELIEESGETPKVLTVLVLGCLMIPMAFFGITTGVFPKRLLLIICSALLAAFAVACIVTSIVILVRRDEIADTLSGKDDCRDNDFYEEADDEIIAGSKIFCTPLCPCDLKPTTKLDTMPPGGFYQGSAKKVPECPCTEGMMTSVPMFDFPPGMPLRPEDCKRIRKIFIDEFLNGKDKYFDLLEWMEEEFDCAGLCTEIDYYLFSDINEGNPKENCMDAVNDWLQDVLLEPSVPGIITGVWFLFVSILLAVKLVKERGTSIDTTAIADANSDHSNEKSGIELNDTKRQNQTDFNNA